MRTRAQFLAVLHAGALARGPHFALHALRWSELPAGQAARDAVFAPPARCWLGAQVPKRHARRAVTRNAIRRQMFAVLQQQRARFAPDMALLLRMHRAFAPQRFLSATSAELRREVRAELLALLEKARWESLALRAPVLRSERRP